MRKKSDSDVLYLLRNFQRDILEKKPAAEKMYEEVRMMHFKIRPIQGDISLLNLNDNQLIEILWSLGKLDEFFQKEIKKLAPKQKEFFFRYFNNLQQKFQDRLNKLNLKQERIIERSAIFELEIFRERLLKKKIN